MRTRALAIAVTTGLVLTLAPATAHAAKKPTFKLSISTSRSVADVGQTIAISGKVSGPKAAKKRLLVQRKVGAGAWKTVRKITTTSKRRYATTVPVTTAGQQYLRVVAPKSKKARAGSSTARGFVGWRWLDAGASAATDGLTRGSLRIDGKVHAPTYVPTQHNDDGYLFIDTGRSCDALVAGLAVEAPTANQAMVYVFQGRSITDDPESFSVKMVSGNSGVVETRWPIKRQSSLVAMMVDENTDNAAQSAGLIKPRVHCSVNALPQAVLPL
ncbi:hypothetical protein [Aeromicrobium duanguangcaii]|uniref:hypothetical protein n=1 Tax=Aeromicrobium duanguangcaii TaxID=2968086 RepID=UPI002016FA70|nr:hypothetical protein [Aeromicrobium duanguangcaii]MCL3838333.1 hypothetical protein [Aeromicrobium duanguangcaii]